MKTDRYLKIILTIIAINLTIIVLQNSNIISNVTAASENAKYSILPVNKDGSIDVNIKSANDILSVQLEEVERDAFRYVDDIPVEVNNQVEINVPGEIEVWCTNCN